MSEAAPEKVTIIATHGPDDAERSILPFMMANAALTMDMEAVIILQGPAVFLATKACHEHVTAGGLPPLKEQMELFLNNGGKLLVCTPCVQFRGMTEEELIQGAEHIAGARVILESTTASAVLNY